MNLKEIVSNLFNKKIKTKNCIKCGHSGQTIEYVPPEYIYICHKPKEKIREEYISLTCKVCGFKDKNQVLSKEKKD